MKEPTLPKVAGLPNWKSQRGRIGVWKLQARSPYGVLKNARVPSTQQNGFATQKARVRPRAWADVPN